MGIGYHQNHVAWGTREKAWQGMKLLVGIRLFGRAILKVLCPYLKRQERVIIQLVAQRNIKTIELGSLFPGFRLVSVDMPVGGLTEVGRDHFSSQNLPVTIRVTTEPLPPRLSAEMAKNGFKRVLFPIIYLTQDEVIWRQTGAAFFALSQNKGKRASCTYSRGYKYKARGVDPGKCAEPVTDLYCLGRTSVLLTPEIDSTRWTKRTNLMDTS
jgi:hypothetical protein